MKLSERMEVHIDASYNVHMDSKGQSGCTISIGAGCVFVSSSKQKLNTKSSTESELVALSDFMSQVVWTKQYLTEQGYDLPINVYEDNMSAITMIGLGRSTSSRTRHINARYYWVRNIIDSNNINLLHLQTTEMIADILTKPLQGTNFFKLRTMLLASPDLKTT